MKKATDSQHTDQVYTASKPAEPGTTPNPGGKRKPKHKMGPGTRAERNERFGEEIVG